MLVAVFIYLSGCSPCGLACCLSVFLSLLVDCCFARHRSNACTKQSPSARTHTHTSARRRACAHTQLSPAGLFWPALPCACAAQTRPCGCESAASCVRVNPTCVDVCVCVCSCARACAVPLCIFARTLVSNVNIFHRRSSPPRAAHKQTRKRMQTCKICECRTMAPTWTLIAPPCPEKRTHNGRCWTISDSRSGSRKLPSSCFAGARRARPAAVMPRGGHAPRPPAPRSGHAPRPPAPRLQRRPANSSPPALEAHVLPWNLPERQPIPLLAVRRIRWPARKHGGGNLAAPREIPVPRAHAASAFFLGAAVHDDAGETSSKPDSWFGAASACGEDATHAAVRQRAALARPGASRRRGLHGPDWSAGVHPL